MWYLSDGYIIAKHHQLREAVAYLLFNDVKASGLHLNLSKCHVWWPTEPTESARAAYPTEISQEYTAGTSILNAPLGTHAFMEDNVGDESQRIGAFIRNGCHFGKCACLFHASQFLPRSLQNQLPAKSDSCAMHKTWGTVVRQIS